MSSVQNVLISIGFVLFAAAANAGQPIDVVLDLDGTMIYQADPRTLYLEPENIIRVGSEQYRLSDHAIEFLRLLHTKNDVRVSFFSGGKEARNRTVVEEIYKRVNSGGATHVPAAIGSFEHLTRIEGVESQDFFKKYKKDLTRLNPMLTQSGGPPIDLEFAVLIDDASNPIVPSQARNLVLLPYANPDVMNPNHTRFASLPRQWQLERSKLAWALGCLLDGEGISRSKNLSFTSAVREVLQKSHSLHMWEKHTEMGLKAMASRIRTIPAPLCVRDHLKGFLKRSTQAIRSSLR